MLELRKIYKNYQVDNKPYPALKEINLSFADQGFVSILGPSGCGKTTLLNLIGGLDQYTKGDLLINGKSTKKFTDRDWDAYRNKRVGFVFQNYNLVPHLTILANVELSLTLSGINHKKRLKLAADALAKVGLKNALKKKPNQLSGGQMQRVAIARALVNNPEIILADEPTGALDSVTSIQVLNLLKKVAKNRLVIMVTHNEELAERYSTRIIKLRDGKIINDSKPIKLKTIEEDAHIEQEKNKQTHMSFFTALGNSFRNLLTKKGRTIMTAVAASFGVIGVALVLAMSNGFSNYVGRVEMATASSVPITISPFVTSAIKETSLPEAWPSEHVIKPYEEDISQLVQLHHNQITKEYANYCREMLKEPHHYASSVLENHEYLDFNIFTERENTSGGVDIIKVDQFKSAGATGTILSGTTDLPSTIFHELYGDKKYISSNYDVIYGQYPNERMYEDAQGNLHCDICLVCDRYNRIPIKTLYELGLSPSEVTTTGATISFDDLIGHRYKSFMPNDVYGLGKVESEEIDVHKVSSKSVWELDENVTKQKFTQFKDITSPFHKEDLKALYNNDKKAVIMDVKGILRLKKDSLINLMPGSICYPTVLKDYYVDKIKEPAFDEYRNIARNNWYIPVAKDEQGEDITQDKWTELLGVYFYAVNTQSATSISNLLENPATSPIIFLNILANKDADDTFHYTTPLLDSNQYRTFQRNNYRFANEFKTPKFIEHTYYDQKIIDDIDPTSIDSFVDPVTYINGYSTITSLLIFPKNLSAKQQVFQYLNQWNVGKPVNQQIQYADLAGTLTNALGTLIDVISIVLICFSAVSLLVACVMTGVITYTSVLERTKEIGILRAIGARKKDVGRLFEAESVIVGAIGGLIGIVFTFIIEGPVSLIINARFPEQKIGLICNLNPLHALLLVLVSVLLTFVAGFIPARKAAKKDPVVALRTE